MPSFSIDVPSWLKSLRLHKYAALFSQMSYEEMMTLTEQHLESQVSLRDRWGGGVPAQVGAVLVFVGFPLCTLPIFSFLSPCVFITECHQRCPAQDSLEHPEAA